MTTTLSFDRIAKAITLEKIYMGTKRYAQPDHDCCVSCGACANECPRDAIQIWHGCYAIVDSTLCVGCGICAKTCPAGCISLIEQEKTE